MSHLVTTAFPMWYIVILNAVTRSMIAEEHCIVQTLNEQSFSKITTPVKGIFIAFSNVLSANIVALYYTICSVHTMYT